MAEIDRGPFVMSRYASKDDLYAAMRTYLEYLESCSLGEVEMTDVGIVPSFPVMLGDLDLDRIDKFARAHGQRGELIFIPEGPENPLG